jgi:hypothetical protein
MLLDYRCERKPENIFVKSQETFDTFTNYKTILKLRKVRRLCAAFHSYFINQNTLRSGAHNPKVTGSSPVPATRKASEKSEAFFLIYKLIILVNHFLIP